MSSKLWPRLSVLLVLFLGCSAWAQSEARYIREIEPLVGQRGKTVPVNITGENLETAMEVRFYRPGVKTASLIPATDGRFVQAKLKISATCPPGQHPFRIRTRDGWTTMSTFYVSPYPVRMERGRASSYEDCQRVTANSSILGYVSRVGEVDYFRLPVQRGQRVSVDVQSVRLARGLFDAHVTIFDDKGRKLAENDDSGLGFQDPLLSIMAPRSGEYRVAVRESGYGNEGGYKGPKGHYILHVGNFPRPLCLIPAGAQPGRSTRFRFLGDLRGVIRQSFKIPALTKAISGQVRLTPMEGNLLAPTSHPVRVSHHVNVIEAEPNNAPRTATHVRPTGDVAFNGVISQRRDFDLFRLQAEVGTEYFIEAFCRRLRSRMDPVVSVHLASGQVIESNDDPRGRLGTGMFRYNTHHSGVRAEDSFIRWKCTKTGDYLIGIRDHLNKGGPDYHYRIEVTRAKPTLNLWVKRNPPYWRGTPGQSISVPQGNRYATMLSYRHRACSFPLSVRPAELPPGVKFVAPALPGNKYVPIYGRSVPMLFEAANHAPLNGVLTRFTAKNTAGKHGTKISTTYEQSTFHGLNPPNYCFYGVDVDRLAVSVARPSFIRLDIARPVRPIVRSGRIDLHVKTQLNPAFKGKVFLELLYLPPGFSSSKSQQVPAGNNIVTVSVEASATAELTTWPMTVVARVATQLHGGGISTGIFPLRVVPPFAEIRIRRTVAKRGRTTILIADVTNTRQPPPGTSVVLKGLPPRTTAAPVSFTGAGSQLRFKIKVNSDALLKQYKSLFCEIHVRTPQGTVVQRCADGGILHVVD